MKQLVVLVTLVLLVAVLSVAAPFLTQAAPAANPGEVRLVESNAQHVVLEIAAPAYTSQAQTINGTTFLELAAVAWGRSDEPGKPQLPLYGALLAVPQQAKISVRVLNDRTHQVQLEHPVLPAPTLQVSPQLDNALPQVKGKAYLPDRATYGAAQPYPAETFSVSDPATWRSQRVVRLQIRPFQFNPARRQLTIHDAMRLEISFGLSRDASTAQVGVPVNEGGFEPALQTALLNYASAQGWRSPARPSSNLPAGETAANATDAYKILVSADGMYRVTCDALQAAGLNWNQFTFDTLKLSTAGSEVALQVQDNGDNHCQSGEAFIFFGQAPTDATIPYDVYWLTYGSGAGKRMTVGAASGGTTPASYTRTLHLEQNNGYVTYAPWVENADHWAWSFVNHPFDPDGNGDPNSVDVTANLSDLTPGATNGTLRVLVQSGSVGNLSAQLQSTLSSNTVQVYQQNWALGAIQLDSVAVTNLIPGTNTFRVADVPYYPGGYAVWLNYLELDYPASFAAMTDTLRFKFSDVGTWQYQIPNYSNANVVAYDITDPQNVSRLNVTASQNGGSYMAAFSDAVSTPQEYLALTTAQYQAPASIVHDTPSNLHDPANGADYIIVTYGAWQNNLQPLVNQRKVLGRVMLVDVQDVYDEFDHGLKSAQALHDFLAYAYANWQPPKPSYVLLVGDGNFDNGNNEPTYIPVNMKLVDPWIGMTASDHRLVTFGSTDLPDMAIGRLPALNASDVDNMVAKLLDYENNTPGGAWRTKVTFASDNAYDSSGSLDPAGNFYNFSDEVAGSSYYMPAPMVADRAYYNPCTDTTTYPWCALPYPSYATAADTRAAILNAFAQGRLIVNYVGHGAVTTWAESMLKSTDAPNLKPTGGTPKYPFMMPMTCYDGYFHSGYSTSLAEALVRQAAGGAIGSFAPTGLGVANGHDFLDRGFFEGLMQLGKPRAGLAAIQAKVRLYTDGSFSSDLLDTFNLMADPGTLLALPAGIMPTPTPSSTPLPSSTASPTPPGGGTPTPTPDCSNKPLAPSLLTPANKTSLSKLRVTLTWSLSTCATKYKLVIREGSKKGPIVLRAPETSPYKTQTLTPGKTYFWVVKACNSAGCTPSAWRWFTLNAN